MHRPEFSGDYDDPYYVSEDIKNHDDKPFVTMLATDKDKPGTIIIRISNLDFWFDLPTMFMVYNQVDCRCRHEDPLYMYIHEVIALGRNIQS